MKSSRERRRNVWGAPTVSVAESWVRVRRALVAGVFFGMIPPTVYALYLKQVYEYQRVYELTQASGRGQARGFKRGVCAVDDVATIEFERPADMHPRMYEMLRTEIEDALAECHLGRGETLPGRRAPRRLPS